MSVNHSKYADTACLQKKAATFKQVLTRRKYFKMQ